MTQEEKIQWCIDKHRETNHFYDNYLPYEFHLRMVAQVCKDFAYLSPNEWSELEVACYGHDLIEDTRTSYNDCKKVLGEFVANIIYAVTNEKGRNRAERASEKYYYDISRSEYFLFIKLCDRIANVQYSKLTKSKMLEMYIKENNYFKDQLFDEGYKPMFDYLDELLNSEPEVKRSVASKA